MWRVENRTPFMVDCTWVRDVNGAEVWVIAIKATYDILSDGTTRLAAEQVPVHTGPVPREGSASLKYDTDLGAAKQATDVILNGHAWTPNGKPMRQLDAGFHIGGMSRMVRVYGDRYWQRKRWSWRPSEPEPFISMPFIYERAFGGDIPEFPPASRNPVGRGIAADAEGRVWMPNIESMAHLIRDRDDVPAAACLGPIASHWPLRRQYAGTYDDAWLKERHPLPPEDFDPRFWQIAPEAQQVPGHFKGGEPVTLINVTPQEFAPGGKLAFRLPKITLVCETFFYDGSREHTRPVIHTVILEPDMPRVSVVHHMALPCHVKVNQLDRTRITQKRRPLDRTDAPGPDAKDARSIAARSA
ncbi:DUF2169 family type VI secretion system accessory protein [Trinickia acidisoli]|uniref:DUF2169 family type VI secretion system accessory protein n=1 Tax=Trinickia acidisoli TaxID=2767482 RepID=UPI001A909422|nr:DUF2169 domain-containing protein [Trinickia acidisoli]